MKTNLSAKPFQPVYQGPRWVNFIEKNAKKSRDTATLNEGRQRMDYSRQETDDERQDNQDKR